MSETTDRCGDKQGTIAGYNRHTNHSEKPCPECREGNNAYMRAYRAARRPPSAAALLLDELNDWATALAETDQSFPGAMVQSSAVGRDLIGYVARIRAAIGAAR